MNNKFKIGDIVMLKKTIPYLRTATVIEIDTTSALALQEKETIYKVERNDRMGLRFFTYESDIDLVRIFCVWK